MATISHQTVKLGLGRHVRPENGACVMELASMLAGEPFTDHPRSVCPVVGEYLRALNDGCGAAVRDQLYPLAAQVVGSRSGSRVRAARRRLCQERLAEIQEATRSRLERLVARASRTVSAGECAAAYLQADRFGDAVAFVDELLALGSPGLSPDPAPAPAVGSAGHHTARLPLAG